MDKQRFKDLYKKDWFEAFYYWAATTQHINLHHLDLDSNEGERLMEKYGHDPEVERLTNECLIEIAESRLCLKLVFGGEIC